MEGWKGGWSKVGGTVMDVNEKPQHSYSHTQLALWRLCQRRYYNHYILGKQEPTTPNMAAGTWLVQEPIEHWEIDREHSQIEVHFQTLWDNFLAEFGGDSTLNDGLFTKTLAKRVLDAYKAAPVDGKVVAIEETFWHEFPGGHRYQSKPDLVVEQEEHTSELYGQVQATWYTRTTWDIKLKTFNQSRAGDTWWLKPTLSPFDDQCLGQAILAGASAFGQIQFWLGKKDGVLHGPFYIEHPVNPVLADEWLKETEETLIEIDMWRTPPRRTPWPKNDASCHAFGKECSWLKDCGFGFEVKS